MKLIVPALVFAGAIFSAGCRSTEPATKAAIEAVSGRVVEVYQKQVPLSLHAPGTIRARESAMVSPQVAGRITEVLVHEGDTVRAGQVLARLDDASLRATAERAQAGVRAAENAQNAAQADSALASSTLRRYRQLQAERSVSPQEMDEVSRRAESAASRADALRAQTAAAQAQEVNARTMLGYTLLRAPFAGVVISRTADPGTLASPGVPLLQIDRAGPLQLHVTVDESAIAAVHKGQRLPLSIDGAGSSDLTGIVDEIVPAADPASHSFLVKIALPVSQRLHTGMYGLAEIPTGDRAAIVAPRSAIVMHGSLPCVYALDANGIARLRSLTLGAVHGNLVEILSGAAPGEKLVDDPADRDLAGKRIEAHL